MRERTSQLEVEKKKKSEITLLLFFVFFSTPFIYTTPTENSTAHTFSDSPFNIAITFCYRISNSLTITAWNQKKKCFLHFNTFIHICTCKNYWFFRLYCSWCFFLFVPTNPCVDKFIKRHLPTIRPELILPPTDRGVCVVHKRSVYTHATVALLPFSASGDNLQPFAQANTLRAK